MKPVSRVLVGNTIWPLVTATALVACREERALDERVAMAESAPVCTTSQVQPERIGDPAVSFGSVDDALLIPGKGLVVADRRSTSIVFLSRTGEVLARRGRVGGGPGEFRHIASIHHGCGDSIVVFDNIAARLTSYSHSGALLASRPLPGTGGLARVIGILRDGAIVVGRPQRPAVALGPVALFQDSIIITVYGQDRAAHVVRAVPGPQRYRDTRRVFAVMYLPFGQLPTYRTLGASLVVARADRPVIELLNLSAPNVSRSFDVPDRSFAVSEEARLRAQNYVLRSGGSAEVMRRLALEIPYPERSPPYGEIDVGSAGGIWIPSPPDFSDGSREWFVMSEEGQMIERIVLPMNQVVLDADRSHVAVRVTGELGIQTLVLYPRSCL